MAAGAARAPLDAQGVRKRRKIVVGAWALAGGIAVYATILVAYDWTRMLRGSLILSFAAVGLSLVAPVAGGVFALWAYHRFTSPAAPAPLIVWLRKFHRTGPGITPFHTLLQSAAAGYGVCITARDTRLPSSLVAGLLRAAASFPLLVVVVELVWFALFAVGLYAFERVPAGTLAAFLMASAGAAVPAYALLRFVRTRGVVKLRRGLIGAGVEALLDRIEHRPQNYTGGIVVLRTPDEDWQEVVLALIGRAHVVLLDVTEVSEHVLWELRTALDHKQAESLILLRGSGAKPLPPLCGNEAELLRRVRWVEYPAYTDRRHLHARANAVRSLEGSISRAIACPLRYAPLRGLVIGIGCVALIGIGVSVAHQQSQPTEPELRHLTLTACGAPAPLFDARSDPLPNPPNEMLAATLRYSIGLHASGSHGQAVTEMLPSHGDGRNPWLLLARGRAFLEAGECDCKMPLVVTVVSAGELTLNGEPVKLSSLGARLQTRAAATTKRRIVFVAPQSGASPVSIVPVVSAASEANFVVAFAPEPLDRLIQLCGAGTPSADKHVKDDRHP